MNIYEIEEIKGIYSCIAKKKKKGIYIVVVMVQQCDESVKS